MGRKSIYGIPPGTCGIYMITCLMNDKRYIGSSKNISKRLTEHFRKMWSKNKLYTDIKKYGRENFKCEILEECGNEDLLAKERDYINKLNPKYNIKLDKKLSDDYLDSEAGRNYIRKLSIVGKRAQLKNQKKCMMLDLEGNKLKEFNSLAEAGLWITKNSRFKGGKSNIMKACRGEYKTMYGYHWKYIEEER